MEIINDQSCGWIDYKNRRSNIKVLNQNLKCDYLIIGAGFTGLSAARKLGELNKNKKIIIVDSQLAGEGASSRNSGYLVDTTLNDGFTSDKDLNNYKKKSHIYNLGINVIKKFIETYQVDCDWNECGKFFASSDLRDEKKALNFSNLLTQLNFENKILYQDDLKKRLGTNFYKIGIYTKGGVLLNPGKLVRSMINALPDNVSLYENSTLLKWSIKNSKVNCEFKKFQIDSEKIIFCTNGFLSSLGVKKRYNFPITLTASMTRPLNDQEFKSIGEPKEWGVLPIKPMGATVRLTKDKRILIRNTAELRNPSSMSKEDLNTRAKIHLIGIKKRFPSLPDDIISSSWSGIVCRSGNSSQIFEKIDKNIFVAGCYNGSGIGVGTLFGEQIAIMAEGENSDEISIIKSRKQPNWLPPQPFLNLGIFVRLLFERMIAKNET
tara:strand:+ start:664 stop:1968 length:1305 start_codon:yes stop_codon:yes gene_type:complete